MGSSFNVDVKFAQTLGATTNISALTLKNLTTGTTVANSQIAAAVSGKDLLLSFSGYAYNLLPDGWYEMTLPIGAVTTASGVPLAAAYTFRFEVLAGDFNRDGIVNVSDLSILAINWQKTGVGNANGDVNYDGIVDVSDLSTLAINWQKSIAAPAASPAITVAKTVTTPVAATPKTPKPKLITQSIPR